MNARALLRAPSGGVAFLLAVGVLANGLFTPGFLTLATLSSIVIQAVTPLLVGTGMTVVIATRGIDLSVGSVMAVASAAAVTLMPHGAFAALSGGLLVGLASGAVNGTLVTRYGVFPILATLAMMMIERGAAQVVVAGNPLVVFTNASFERLGKGYVEGVPLQVVVTTVIVIAVAVVVRATVFGRSLVAIGGNDRAARLAGIRVRTVTLLAYATSGLLAAFAGLVETARLGATDAATIGKDAELDAIVAAVVGGTPLTGGRASIAGTAAGALLMSLLSATLAMHLVQHTWALVAKASLLVAAVWTQRQSAS